MKINSDRLAKVPFRLDRDSRIGLAEQIADGFGRAIKDGIYSPGDKLPTIKELATFFSVGEITIRGALATLTNLGLVNPRRGVGAVVVGPGGRLRRGRVLIVTGELSSNYCFSVMTGILQQELLQAGYQPYRIAVLKGNDGRVGYWQLDQMLGESISLVVLFGTVFGIRERIRRAGIPCIAIGDPDIADVTWHASSALPDFIAHCRSVGAHDIMLPVTPGSDRRWLDALTCAGLQARCLNIRHERLAETLGERVFRGAFKAFERRLSAGRDWLPDVFLFMDDFVAFGALYAMDMAGVRIPEDVGVVTWCARGSFPFYRKRLTCLETDPYAGGRMFSRHVLEALAGKPLPEGLCIRSTYKIGETFR